MSMTYFYIGIGIIAVGIFLVIWLLMSEKKETERISLPNPKEKGTSRTNLPEENPENVLKRLGLEQNTSKNSIKAKPNPFAFLKNFGSKNKKDPTPIKTEQQVFAPEIETGSASLSISTELEKAGIREDHPAVVSSLDPLSSISELQLKIKDLEDKKLKIENLLKEKSELLEKSDRDLIHEQKNRKEFNKVKDILEKEIKDRKDQIQDLEIKLSASQTEVNSHLKRIDQLEEKVKNLESEIKNKENEIKDTQQSVQLEKKLKSELEAKLKEKDPILQEKDKKIEELVRKIHEIDSQISQNHANQPPKTPLPAAETVKIDKREEAPPASSDQGPKKILDVIEPKHAADTLSRPEPQENQSPAPAEKPLEKPQKEPQSEQPLSIKTKNNIEKQKESEVKSEQPKEAALKSPEKNLLIEIEKKGPKLPDKQSDQEKIETEDSPKIALIPDITKQDSEPSNEATKPKPDTLKKGPEQTKIEKPSDEKSESEENP